MKLSFASSVLLIISVSLISCGDLPPESKPKAEFKQAGYAKADNKTRVFSISVIADSAFVADSAAILLNMIENHGSKLAHTKGKVTTAYYFIPIAPDITHYSVSEARDLCAELKPFAEIWIKPNGRVDLIKD